MAKLTIIVGMGGSGKSTLCEEIVTKSNGKAQAFKDATLTNTDPRRAGHECLGELVARLLGKEPRDCVMDEPHLVNAEFRREFKRFCNTFLNDVDQQWIFFKKDVVACINNVYNDWEIKEIKRVERLISLANQIKEYNVPSPGVFPGHEEREVKEGFRTFTEEGEAICWLYKKIFEEFVVKK